MHLSAPVQNWLESLLGFIGLEAQTLTLSSIAGEKTMLEMEGIQIGGVQSAVGWVGRWTRPRHEVHTLAGPSWAFKLVYVRATLPPSTLFADRVLLHRGYSISAPNALVETVSKYKGLY